MLQGLLLHLVLEQEDLMDPLLYFQLSLQQVVEQVVYLEMMVQEHQVILEVQVEVVAEELMM